MAVKDTDSYAHRLTADVARTAKEPTPEHRVSHGTAGEPTPNRSPWGQPQ